MERVMDAIRAIRNRRAEMNVPPSRKARGVCGDRLRRYLLPPVRPSSSGWLRPRRCEVGESFDGRRVR